jgi:hypothetical protein
MTKKISKSARLNTGITQAASGTAVPIIICKNGVIKSRTIAKKTKPKKK